MGLWDDGRPTSGMLKIRKNSTSNKRQRHDSHTKAAFYERQETLSTSNPGDMRS